MLLGRRVKPLEKVYDELKKGSGKQQIATTMAFVRLLRDLMKDPEIGHRIVPIAPWTSSRTNLAPTARATLRHVSPQCAPESNVRVLTSTTVTPLPVTPTSTPVTADG